MKTQKKSTKEHFKFFRVMAVSTLLYASKTKHHALNIN